MDHRLATLRVGAPVRSLGAPHDLLVEFPEDALTVVGAYHLQERVPDLAPTTRVHGAEYAEAVDELLLWMRRREAVVERAPGIDSALAVMRAHARRRRWTIVAVVLLVVLTAAVGTLSVLLVKTSRELTRLSAEHRDTREILTTVQGAYLDMRRELNELEGR